MSEPSTAPAVSPSTTSSNVSVPKTWQSGHQPFQGFTKVHYLILGAIFFFAQLFVTSGHLMSPDGEVIYRTAESIATRGELRVYPLEYIGEEESYPKDSYDPIARLAVPPQFTRLTVQGRDGNFYGQYLPLQSLLAAPLIWVADVTFPVLGNFHHSLLPDTDMHPLLTPKETWRRGFVVMLFNPLVQTLTLLVLLRMVVFITNGNRNAALAVAAALLGTTMVWPHSRSFFTESLASLLFLVALDFLIRWYFTVLSPAFSSQRLKQMIIIGVALGLSVWTRADSPLLVLGFAISLVLLGELKRYRESAYAISEGKFPIRDYLISGGITLAMTIGLIAFNQWRFAENATLFGGGYGDEAEGVKFSTPLLVGLQGYLMSPGKSILLFSPGILLGLWGWARTPKHMIWLRRLMIIAYLPFTIGMIKWQNWDGGWCWGPRHIVQLHVPIMLGCIFLFQKRLKLWEKTFVYIIGTVGVFVQLFASTQSPLDFYREMFITPEDGLYYTISYRPNEVQTFMNEYRLIGINHEDDRLSVPVSPMLTPAPLTDSLYVPQHTQWTGYPILWKEGYCDFLLLRIFGAGANRADIPESSE